MQVGNPFWRADQTDEFNFVNAPLLENIHCCHCRTACRQHGVEDQADGYGWRNGEPVVIEAIMKPLPTTIKGLHTVNIESKEDEISLKERSDVCAVPSASIIGEAILSIEIFNSIQDKFGRDNINEILENYNNYKRYLQEA